MQTVPTVVVTLSLTKEQFLASCSNSCKARVDASLKKLSDRTAAAFEGEHQPKQIYLQKVIMINITFPC